MDPFGYKEINSALSAVGLLGRGGFLVAPGDSVPALFDGRPTRTVIMAGNAGTAMWKTFTKARPSGQDPLDRWSRRVLDVVAARYDASVAMPSDGPPYLPFQRWAMRAEPVQPSPLGLLIHPRWGLWHGYRGALLFAEALELPKQNSVPSLCDTCDDKPCLSACPVEAFTGTEYRVEACATHLKAATGMRCLTQGCLARHACPIGQDACPSPDQAAFHMDAFLSSRHE